MRTVWPRPVAALVGGIAAIGLVVSGVAGVSAWSSGPARDVAANRGDSFQLGRFGQLSRLRATTRYGTWAPGAAPRCTGVHVRPGQSIQAALWDLPPRATLCIDAGLHRLRAPLSPKQGQRLIGLTGAILDGSQPVSGFRARADHRWAGGPVANQVFGPGYCMPARESLCRWSSDVFVDNHLLQRVGRVTDVRPGTYFVDDDRMLVLGQDPTGRRVEISETPSAFSAGYPGVTVRNLVIQKFATPAQSGGAVGPGSQSGWTMDHLEVRWNHSAGIQAGPSNYVYGNFAHDNGQEGMCGHGSAVRVERNEISHNNTDGYDPRWEAGGAKFVETTGLVLRDNSVHDNNGPGLWTDIYNVNVLVQHNVVTSNRYEGIFEEIGYAGRILGNTIVGNGTALPVVGDSPYGAGILISSSSDVEVAGNVLKANANGVTLVQENRGSGPRGPLELHGNNIHGNKITMARGRTGLFQYVHDDSYYKTRGNRFANNSYFLVAPGENFFWMDRSINGSTWRLAGNDVGGQLNVRS